MKYKCYHSCVKICHALGVEKQLISHEFLDSISPSTSHYWKSDSVEKYLGSEFSKTVDQNLGDVQTILDHRLRRTKKVFVAICRLQITIINLIGIKEFRSILKNNRDTVVDMIGKVSSVLGGTELVCRVLHINYGSFKTWKRYQAYSCPTSPLRLCFKRVPQQISFTEINVLKKYMTDSRYLHWSAASIWGYCFKTGKTSMARATWYQYARLLGLTQKRKVYKAKRKKISFQADTPNQTWHMDVSYFKTLDNIQYYVYTVLDNFSRKILAYDVTRELSGRVRMDSLRRAIASVFDVTLVPKQSVELIVDGGSENNNQTVEDFIRSSHVAIDKKIALKDVTFSNSVVEGNFRIMKQSYFRKRSILSNTIVKEMDFFVEDYNNHRPHYIHQIYTPREIHDNPSLKNVRPRLKGALKDRIASNKKRNCIKDC